MLIHSGNIPTKEQIDAALAELLDWCANRCLDEIVGFTAGRTERVPITVAEMDAFGRLRDAINVPGQKDALARAIREAVGGIMRPDA
jgi:hypothetical protein